MPTSLIHFKVGYNYAKAHKNYDDEQFYLGLIVPDTVNLNGFAEKEKRWNAHKRDADLEIWKDNIFKFYNENKEKIDEKYLCGYLVHVLTDIIFDEKNPNDLMPKIEEKVSKEYIREEYSKQLDLYECSQLQEEWWAYVKQKLKKSKAQSINNLDRKDIEKYRDLIIGNYDIKYKDEFDLITPQYIDDVVRILESYMKQKNII